jgi:PTS system mannose-specific IIA component
MIGILIVTHGGLGDALLETATQIIGSRPEKVVAVSVDGAADPERMRDHLSAAVKSVKNGQGKAVILTDMYGGTPCNLSLSFIQKGRVEVISAVNLPILLRAVDARERMDFTALMNCLEACAKRNIVRAVGVLDKTGGACCPLETTHS